MFPLYPIIKASPLNKPQETHLPTGSMINDKGHPLGQRVLIRECFESSWKLWEVRGVLPNSTGEQAKAQRSSVTGHALGQNLALNLGLPPWFLPLTPFFNTACFLCSPAGQPGLILDSGALCPHTAGASRSLGPAGLPGEWRQQCQDIFAQGEGGYTG